MLEKLLFSIFCLKLNYYVPHILTPNDLLAFLANGELKFGSCPFSKARLAKACAISCKLSNVGS